MILVRLSICMYVYAMSASEFGEFHGTRNIEELLWKNLVLTGGGRRSAGRAMKAISNNCCDGFYTLSLLDYFHQLTSILCGLLLIWETVKSDSQTNFTVQRWVFGGERLLTRNEC